MTTTRLGKWHLIGRVALGSTSAVWVGARGPGDRCALKVLHEHVAVHDDMLRRFILEAKALSQVKSRHVPALVELARCDGQHLIAMELVDGPSLSAARRVLPGPVPRGAALAIARDVARALSALHDDLAVDGAPFGLVHRDVAPPNILVERDGDGARALLIDLGLAHGPGGARAPAEQTAPGMERGRLAYTSPEQVRGETATPAVDVYALGVVLYELVCGRKPFTATDPEELRHAILEAPLDDPRGLVPDLDGRLAETLRALLAPDPSLRPTAGEALQALDGALVRTGAGDGGAALAAYVKSLSLPSLKLA